MRSGASFLAYQKTERPLGGSRHRKKEGETETEKERERVIVCVREREGGRRESDESESFCQY